MSEVTDLERRISDVEQDVKKLQDETNCAKVWQAGTTGRLDNMLVLLGKLESAFAKLEAGFEELKSKPSRRWDTLINAIIMSLGGAIVALILKFG